MWTLEISKCFDNGPLYFFLLAIVISFQKKDSVLGLFLLFFHSSDSVSMFFKTRTITYGSLTVLVLRFQFSSNTVCFGLIPSSNETMPPFTLGIHGLSIKYSPWLQRLLPSTWFTISLGCQIEIISWFATSGSGGVEFLHPSNLDTCQIAYRISSLGPSWAFPIDQARIQLTMYICICVCVDGDKKERT